MTVYLSKGNSTCKAAWDKLDSNKGSSAASLAIYYTGPGDTNWDALADATCTVRTTLHDNVGQEGGVDPNWTNMPKPGNFVLQVESGVNNQITIKSFSAGELN